eukprot:420370_1
MSNISNKTKPKTICSRLQIVNLHTPMKKTVNRYIISNNNHKNNSHQRHLRTPDASTALIYLQETEIDLNKLLDDKLNEKEIEKHIKNHIEKKIEAERIAKKKRKSGKNVKNPKKSNRRRLNVENDAL